jgi:hypothetical protein
MAAHSGATEEIPTGKPSLFEFLLKTDNEADSTAVICMLSILHGKFWMKFFSTLIK